MKERRKKRNPRMKLLQNGLYDWQRRILLDQGQFLFESGLSLRRCHLEQEAAQGLLATST